MDSKTFAWQSEFINTTELVSVSHHNNGYSVTGQITGEAMGSPLDIQYQIELSLGWIVKTLSVQASSSPLLDLKRNSSGKWTDGRGEAMPLFDDCIDVDISLTPFTNTLPIKRLKILPGKAEGINVLYINLPEAELKPVRQVYANVGNNVYKYENLTKQSAFFIKTDSEGFVISYPGMWRRVYPRHTPLATQQANKDFFNALISDGPSPELGDAASLYSWLVGRWEMVVIEHFEDGTKVQGEGECIFTWVLEGRAIQDLWISPKRLERAQPATKLRNRYGTTLRIYHPGLKKWKIYWHNPVNGSFNELMAQKSGNEILQEGIDANGNKIRWSFKEITSSSFHWTGETSADNGETWKTGTEFFGKRKY